MNIPETAYTTTEHVGPHIPTPHGADIADWSVGGIHITNTIFTTWIFMAFLFVLIGIFSYAIQSDRFPRLKTLGLDIVTRLVSYIGGLLGDIRMAHRYIWLLGGLMIVIFLGNLFGLVMDFLVLVSRDEWLGAYLRPIYSDLATTLVFSLTVIMIAQFTALKMK